ncbi:UDP-N-acetylglucosamine pyrophosphorylase [Melia azedarach]|uniref:UDP-N-acetylglucosamine pyrophosphorylase n=1 Tax=Melia azedarach TaxID=155640 RepID=A0ACC1Y4A9_MELAZ|nr:UDP-N-acetylglucosamine pyrophosphorylase [Melia azedarach]
MPPKNETKPKSVRKPLRDVSNNGNSNNGGGRFSKSVNVKKKLNEKQIEEDILDDATLDRLLLVQSDLSALLQQIDELVVQAFKVKTSKEGRKEVDSFSNVLSDMLSTLKPWFRRFQKMLSTPVESEKQLGESLTSKTVSTTTSDETCELGSPEEIKEDTLISPSPLVSWRANCTIERGRQLFLLTPLPMSKALSSKHQDPSKSIFERINCSSTIEVPPLLAIPGDENDDLLEGVAIKPTPSKPSDSITAGMGNTLESGYASSPMFPERDHSMLMMTPCLKLSPPKSCVLLEPISESTHKPKARVRRSTPFPIGLQKGSESSESSGSEDSEGLAFKYPEILGIRQACKSGIAKKDLEASPIWLFSPPKSCVLLEPPDEKKEEAAPADNTLPVASVTNPAQNPSLLQEKENNVQSGCNQTEKSFHPEPFGGNSALIESTPLWKEPESTFRTGKRPGENTLKKELWTKFEAASTFGTRHNASAIRKTAQKGFLDMLDEASVDEDNLALDGLR